ncbi:MAG: lipopolysaccharide kinase InaA family protein [Candidatus Brocadiaceae bacterium]
MQNRRTDTDYHKVARQRILVYGALAVFSAVATVVVLIGADNQSDAFRRQARLNQQSVVLLSLASRIETDCRVAYADFAEVDPVMLAANLQELAEEINDGSRAFAHSLSRLDLGERRGELLEEIAELTAAVAALPPSGDTTAAAIADCAQRANTVRESVLQSRAEAVAAVSDRAEQTALVMHVAAACVVVVVLVAGVGLFLTLFDMLDQTLGPIDVHRELAKLTEEADLHYRILKLAPDADVDPEQGAWDLTLDRVLQDHRTHLTFEALAACGGNRVRLWGKVYKWAGWMKGLQRLFWPAYGRATWRALQRMRHCGLSAPYPLVFSRIRRRGITVGSILLTEHVGEVEPVKVFLRTKFELMDGTARRRFLRGLVQFWAHLHACGIYRVRRRYLHCSAWRAGETEAPAFYLFDLDKVMVARWRLPLLDHVVKKRANRRLLRWLGEELTAEELEFCAELLEEAVEPAAVSGAP